MIKPIERILHSLLLLVFIGTSSSIVYILKNEPSAMPSTVLTSTPVASLTPPAAVTRRPPLPSDTPAPVFATTPVPRSFTPAAVEGWSLLQPGLERRVIGIHNDQNQQVESLYIWRLDQDYFRMDVAFDGSPKSLDIWQRETNAALIVNGGYFSINNKRYSPDGLTVLHGQTSGRSFNGFGGMLAIHDDRAELRWLVKKPYTAGEPLRAALQSFPILVQPGGQIGFGAERDNLARARRTVIAQDKQGRILFIVAPDGYFTLHELSVYLTGSDLDLDIALNLDGGGSTGILVSNPREIVPSKVLLPFVILVYTR